MGVVLVVVAAAFAWAAETYRRADMEKLPLTDAARSAAGGSYVRLEDGVVHYQLEGPSGAQTIVLVHGFSVPYYIWDPLYDALTSAGLRVLRYDLFGRGYSDRPDATYDAVFFDRQLVRLLDALHLDQPVDLAGLSMGGLVVETFANRHPERTRSVILIDPAFDERPAESPFVMHVPLLRDFLMTVYGAPKMADGQLGDFHHPEKFPDWPDRYRVQMRYPGFRRAILSTRLANEGRDVASEFRELGAKPIPVLLIWGKEDRTVPFERSAALSKLVPRAEFHAIEDAGHVPYMEHPEVVNPIVVRFVKGGD
jgi:pimeloyl-ACP methyl ester carboxylesterase